EAALWEAGEPRRASLTLENYQFEPRGIQPDGWRCLASKPRPKNRRLSGGYFSLSPEVVELGRLKGRPPKRPSSGHGKSTLSADSNEWPASACPSRSSQRPAC